MVNDTSSVWWLGDHSLTNSRSDWLRSSRGCGRWWLGASSPSTATMFSFRRSDRLADCSLWNYPTIKSAKCSDSDWVVMVVCTQPDIDKKLAAHRHPHHFTYQANIIAEILVILNKRPCYNTNVCESNLPIDWLPTFISHAYNPEPHSQYRRLTCLQLVNVY